MRGQGWVIGGVVALLCCACGGRVGLEDDWSAGGGTNTGGTPHDGGSPAGGGGSGGGDVRPSGGRSSGGGSGGGEVRPSGGRPSGGGSGGGGEPCPAGWTLCPGGCVDLGSSPLDCGACGVACPAGSSCLAGVCVGVCPPGATLCDGACVNVLGHPAHCGGCNVVCPAGFSCRGGVCSCEDTLCGSACVDLRTAPENCGSCGVHCGGATECVRGGCACPGGETQCGDDCPDLSTDPRHCGDCFAACSPGEQCVEGLCVGGPSCQDQPECAGESCCTPLEVEAGTLAMGRGTERCEGCRDGCPPDTECEPDEVPEHPAGVGYFQLDRYEVTVGRFRPFVAAVGAGWRPAAGAGACPEGEANMPVPEGTTGWQSAWDIFLIGDAAAFEEALLQSSLSTYWPTGEERDAWPLSGATWYEAFAFCIWEGGRLPFEVEWEYAATGGEQNRLFPWGDDWPDPLPANYQGNQGNPHWDVGREPGGDGRWGHADLAGSLEEWVFDWYSESFYAGVRDDCVTCANVYPGEHRVVRGGSWVHPADRLRAASRSAFDPGARSPSIGFRCAWDPR